MGQNLPISEPTYEEKLAFIAGCKQGGEGVLGSIRSGLTLQQAEDLFLSTHRLIRELVENLEEG
jgi:hypothetical protein